MIIIVIIVFISSFRNESFFISSVFFSLLFQFKKRLFFSAMELLAMLYTKFTQFATKHRIRHDFVRSLVCSHAQNVIIDPTINIQYFDRSSLSLSLSQSKLIDLFDRVVFYFFVWWPHVTLINFIGRSICHRFVFFFSSRFMSFELFWLRYFQFTYKIWCTIVCTNAKLLNSIAAASTSPGSKALNSNKVL